MTRTKITRESLLQLNFQELPLIDGRYVYTSTFTSNMYSLVEIRSYSPEYRTYVYIDGDRVCEVKYNDDIVSLEKIMTNRE